MIPKIVRNDFLVWLGLLGITLASWIMFEGLHSRLAVYGIVILSSLKVYLIGVSFMEIFRASPLFMNLFHIWVVGVTVMFCSFIAFHF